MAKFLSSLIFCFSILYSSTPSVNQFEWPIGLSFLQFLEKSEIPLSLYYNLDKEAQELSSEIRAGSICEILSDENGNLKQILIPISEELQIHIYKDKFGKFKLIFDPVFYEVKRKILAFELENSPYLDILNYSGSSNLANAFVNAFRSGVNFGLMKKKDEIAIVYTQKIRLGKVLGMPVIHSAYVKTGGEKFYRVFYNGRYYTEKGESLDTFLLIPPITNARITSRFTLKRFHPVLKIYRAHLGVDYGSKIGTPIKSAGDGIVSFAGKKSGYGNTVEIKHSDGYLTLYAHVKNFAAGIKRGSKIKQGQLVAYVGNSGLATGPHLHFGVYKNSRPIDPLSVVKNPNLKVISEKNIEFTKLSKDAINELNSLSKQKPERVEVFETFMEI